jgi:peptidoglycan hydrolase-like protein with peptidoglycan-binding domain
MNGMVDTTRAARRRTLTPGPYLKRTAASPLPHSRGRSSLGQGETFYDIFLPEEAPPVPIAEILREGSLPAPGETPAGDILLRRGDRGDGVRKLQLQLRRLGFPAGSVDGVFGPVTEQAVRMFQQSVGLPSTGLVDKATWDLVNSSAPAPPETGAPIALRSPVPPAPQPAPSPPPSTTRPTETKEEGFLGLPTGVWVVLGVVVAALFATAPPAAGRPAPGPGAPRR